MNFKVLWFEKGITRNFKFDCNSLNVIYRLICKRRRKQYVVSTVTKFHLRFKWYKSNVQLYGEEQRGFIQENLIGHFFCPNLSGTHKDISFQITDHSGPNDQKRREDFWIHHLETIFPKGLNQKKLLRYN